MKLRSIIYLNAILMLILISSFSAASDSTWVRSRIVEGEYVNPGDLLKLNVFIDNFEGSDNVEILAFVDDMRIYAVQGPFKIKSYSKDRNFYLPVPRDAKEGLHNIKIMVFDDEGFQSSYYRQFIVRR